MNYIEKGWIDAARDVSSVKLSISGCKRQQLLNRLNKKAIEQALREHKPVMNSAMRAGNYSEVSRQHKVINIFRQALHKVDVEISYTKARIKSLVNNLKIMEQRRDQFERAYRLVEAADQLAMANSEIMADVPIIPMADGDMEQIVKDLGY